MAFSIRDITGCFPNMPKQAIEMALVSELHKLHVTCRGERTLRGEGPAVENGKMYTFSNRVANGTIWIPFAELVRIMQFALHKARSSAIEKATCGGRRTESRWETPTAPGCA